MLELERVLAEKLTLKRVRIAVPDSDTVVFHEVPTDSRFFNKSHTNLLLKRTRTGMPFVVCVDEDLEYTGTDAHLLQVFTAGKGSRGWRPLAFSSCLQPDLHEAAKTALAALGFDGREPTLAPADTTIAKTGVAGKLLAGFGTDLSKQILDSGADATVGRTDEIDEVVSCLLRWGQTRLSIIAGESGVGKTNLLYGVARKLSVCRPQFKLITVDLSCLLAGTLFEAEGENLLSTLLHETVTSTETILVLEHLQLATTLNRGPLLLASALDNKAKIAGTLLPGYLPCLSNSLLKRRVSVVELTPLSPGDTASVLRAVGPRMAAHHGVEIDESCILACVQVTQSLPGHLPGQAITLLDAAGARAAVSGAKIIGPDEVYFAADQIRNRMDWEGDASP